MIAPGTGAATPPGTVHFVRPRATDPPSGGDVYDDKVRAGLRGLGWRVHNTVVPGDWPSPTARQHTLLQSALDAIPTGETVLLDGLVACCAPRIVRSCAQRLRLVGLVHLPFACETGLDGTTQTRLHQCEGRTLRACHGVVVPSEWTARYLIVRHGVRAERVDVAGPGVDAAAPARGTDGAGGLLTVAALTPMKAQDLLVDALALVSDLDWCWTCVGSSRRDPGYADDVVDRVDQHGLRDRMRFNGPCRGADLAAAYEAADLLVVPSRAETYGLVVTEALARAVPVLCTAVGGVPEALGRAQDGCSPGVLVPPESPEALATALRQWLVDPALRARLRSAARDRRGTLNTWWDTSQRLGAALNRVRRADR